MLPNAWKFILNEVLSKFIIDSAMYSERTGWKTSYSMKRNINVNLKNSRSNRIGLTTVVSLWALSLLVYRMHALCIPIRKLKL